MTERKPSLSRVQEEAIPARLGCVAATSMQIAKALFEILDQVPQLHEQDNIVVANQIKALEEHYYYCFSEWELIQQACLEDLKL